METPVGCGAGLLVFGSSRFLKNLMETSNDVVTDNGSILPLSGRGTLFEIVLKFIKSHFAMF